MALALFDLDNTLLDGDSDHLWGVFLSEQGIVDRSYYEKENDRFYQEYKDGELDIMEFLRFAMKPLADNPREKLEHWREQFLAEKIRPAITQAARDLVDQHKAAGDTCMVITATNSFVTAPITEMFGIGHLIATLPEQNSLGEYTGNVAGTPSFREGKVERLHEWLQTQQQSLEGSFFYSDSNNDLPLLEIVDNPVVVNADERLLAHAQQHGWPQMQLRRENI